MSRSKAHGFPVRIPFAEALGLELHGADDGVADVRVHLRDDHRNAWEVAHGGVVMTMLDIAMAFAARSRMHEGVGVATIEMKSSFLRPAEGQLRAVGKLVHKTTTLAFCEAALYDEHEALCATATGTFKVLRALPARGRLVTQTPSTHHPKDAT